MANDMTNAEQTLIMETLAPEVARALGQGWSTRRPENSDGFSVWRYLVNGQKELSLCLQWNDKTRVVIGGRLQHGLHDHRPYNVSLPEITVALKRGGEAIAKEIERRVLPEYDSILAKAIERKRDSDEYKAKRAAILTAIDSVLGEPGAHYRARWDKPDVMDVDRFSFKGGDVYANNQTVDLKLDGLSLEQAVRVLFVAGIASYDACMKVLGWEGMAKLSRVSNPELGGPNVHAETLS